MPRGAFVVVEGVDRCGKTSQTIKLIESLKLKAINAERMAFPDRTTWTGQVISKYLNNKECKLNDNAIHLLFSANRWESFDKIKEKLSSGISLIVDRYSHSGMAFSAAKGLNLNWCLQPEIGLPKPDLVLFLNVNAENQMKRPGFGGERYETSEMQEKVTKFFHQFVYTEDNWEMIDANNSFDVVHADLMRRIEMIIKDVAIHNKPLQYLNSEKDSNKENEIYTHVQNGTC